MTNNFPGIFVLEEMCNSSDKKMVNVCFNDKSLTLILVMNFEFRNKMNQTQKKCQWFKMLIESIG